MEDRLSEHLAEDLPGISSTDREDMVNIIRGKIINRSVNSLTASLVDSGVEIGPLLSALLRCEWQSIQYLMEHSDPGNVNAMVSSFSHCVEHFSELQASIVSAFDRKWHSAVDEEVHKRVLAQCKNVWMEKGFVQLHNYFREMPVSVKAKYLGSSGLHLDVGLTPEVGRVFAASEDMREAYSRSPDDKHVIRFGALDARNQELKLVVRDVEGSRRELRTSLRIQPEELLPVRLNRHGEALQARMHDISATGMGLELDEGVDIQPGELVSCVWAGNAEKIFLEAHVRWSAPLDGKTRAGLLFVSLGPFSEPIRRFMLSEQQKLIGRIRNLAAPTWMRGKQS